MRGLHSPLPTIADKFTLSLEFIDNQTLSNYKVQLEITLGWSYHNSTLNQTTLSEDHRSI